MATDASFVDLIDRACRRDELAVTELVRQFEPELRRVIRFRLTDRRLRRFLDSLDVCQSVLGTFFAQLQSGGFQFSHPRQLAGLLALIAEHKVIDRGRQHLSPRHGGGKVREFNNGEAESAVSPTAAPDETVANQDLLRTVRNRLPAEDQAILDLWLEDREWNEISVQLGGQPDALRKRLSRAIDRIAKDLGLV